MFILTEKNIDHFHRIGSSYVDENKGNTCKSLIVLEELYNARPRDYENGKKKPGNKLQSQ